MHIPPYYKQRKWQFFFVGTAVGAVIGYLSFLYVYGEHTERWIEENLALRNELREVQKTNELLLQDQDDMSKESQRRMQVQQIEIEWLNIEDVKIDRFTIYHLNNLVEDELNPIIGSQVEDVAEQRELVIRAIENKVYQVNQINYSVKVVYLTIAPKLIISLEISQESG